MKWFIQAFFVALLCSVVCVKVSFAANLHVTPVGLNLTAPVGAGLVTIRNDGKAPITVQLRVFKWDQKTGEDVYLPTKDVVASPPMVKLAPGAQQAVRVVRTTKGIKGQETYRLLVDELPTASNATQSGVRFLVRQSIPVFFNDTSVSGSKVKWTASSNGRQLILSAQNSGADRLKVSQLLLKDHNGKGVARIDGLAGYVLGGRTKKWVFAIPAGLAVPGRKFTLTAEDDKGPIRASVSISSGG
ncbi:molecular chaperone [Ochrobactrum sp. EDr1-4]|uniref:fimbrial biogenesis chaperone n=1 Tax=Ochrobactrum sp. EDr1-4 TaxID=3368622 RepID=UPI003BA29011